MVLFWTSCALLSGDEDTSPGVVDDAPITQVIVEVDHGPGASPRTGGFGGVDDVWSLTQANLEALFVGVPIDVPHDLVDMEPIAEVPEGDDGAFDRDELLAISARTRQDLPAPGVAAYHVLFLDGRFADESGVRDSVLGVSLGGTTVVALFTPVIDGAALLEPVRAFVEQTTLVHELGHAVGLVNTGLPMVDDHEDPEHPGHDIDDGCVMFWANEGAADLVAFVTQVVREDSVVLFDDACIADVRAGLPLAQ